MKKQVSNVPITPALLLFLLLLFSSSLISARFLETKPGLEKKLDEIKGSDFTHELLGSEESCDKGDEECLKRRIIEEAHLDYIYTQDHKP